MLRADSARMMSEPQVWIGVLTIYGSVKTFQWKLGLGAGQNKDLQRWATWTVRRTQTICNGRGAG